MSNALAVLSDLAPAPIGPYSQAVRADNLLFCSGQIPLDPKTGEIIAGGIEEQAEQVMHNLAAVLKAGGATFHDVVKTTIYLVDMNDFAKVNAVYGKFCGPTAPARATVAVAALPKGARVEIDCIAALA